MARLTLAVALGALLTLQACMHAPIPPRTTLRDTAFGPVAGSDDSAASGTFRTSSCRSITIFTRAVIPGSSAPSRLEVASTTV